jgi:hypothetical protein
MVTALPIGPSNWLECRRTSLKPEKEMSNSTYIFGISFVGTVMFWAVHKLEPNRRYALILKCLIVFVSVAALAGRVGTN